MSKRFINESKLAVFTALLGASCGAVLWVFLKSLGWCKEFIWGNVPEFAGTKYIMVAVCAAFGLAAGIIRKKYGDYPEELQTVLGRIRKEHRYEYRMMPVMLVSAFIPLVCGASVGPEAGLTGVIAGLCYWVSDNVKFAKNHSDACMEVGAAVTVGSLFHAPLFGIFTVEEVPENTGSRGGGESSESRSAFLKSSGISRVSKAVLYGLALVSAFFVIKALNTAFGDIGGGFPSFSAQDTDIVDYLLMLLYIPCGVIICLLFIYSEKVSEAAAGRVPGILRETLCGALIGAAAVMIPEVAFSGEEQMGSLPDTFAKYIPAALIGICALKVILTAFCIKAGLKGGHFFPLIYACSCMGFGLAAFIFAGGSVAAHAVFASAVVTAAALGAQMKKPLAVSMLLMICFPLKLVLWIFLAAAIGSRAAVLIESRKAATSEKE